MTDQAVGEVAVPDPPQLRQGPGAFAWISLALLVLAAGTLVFGAVTGAYGLTVASIFAVIALSFPTLILMGVWIEVRNDNRAALRRFEAEVAKSPHSLTSLPVFGVLVGCESVVTRLVRILRTVPTRNSRHYSQNADQSPSPWRLSPSARGSPAG